MYDKVPKCILQVLESDDNDDDDENAEDDGSVFCFCAGEKKRYWNPSSTLCWILCSIFYGTFVMVNKYFSPFSTYLFLIFVRL